VKKPNYGLSEHEQKLFTQAYHASTSLMDAQVGKLLAAVDKLGIGPNTLIVFISDHGWCLGEHGQWQKQLLFEEVARVPMIFYDPGNKANGKTSTRPVELVDLYPTLADLCDLPAPQGAEGKSIRKLVEDPSAQWDTPAFTQVSRGKNGMGRSVRTEKWRYTQWDGGDKGVELYDQENDPKEYKNLAGDAKYADTVAKLKAMLPAK
jgi:iduronate 2-sulfatase